MKYTKSCYALLWVLFLLYTNMLQAREMPATLQGAVANTSLYFIENKGQVTDQHGTVRSDIDYKLKANDLNLFISNGTIHYQWYRSNEKIKNRHKANDAAASPGVDIYRMDVSLEGANKHAACIASDPAEYFENYYTTPAGLQGATAHSFKRIVYKDVYPGIDWVLYTCKGGLKYDFIVHPGADFKNIRIKYNGATKLALQDGNLVAATPYGSITERAPYTYDAETKETINSNFVLNGNILTYNAASSSAGIVIDPTLEWLTFYGGQGMDHIAHMCSDGVNVYLTGTTTSTTNIATTGAYQTSIGSTGLNADAFIAKFSPSCNLLWATYFGSSGHEVGQSICYDAAGYIYATGQTGSTSNIATSGAHQSSLAGSSDAFLAKFSTAGTLQWSTYYGGSNTEDFAYATCDGNSNVFLSGATSSSTGIATSGSYQSVLNGLGDVYIAKFNSAGVRQWGTYYGGSGTGSGENIEGIDCDPSGNVIIAGWANSNNGIATSGSQQSSLAGSSDGFVSKFTTSGALAWGTYFGGSGSELGGDVVCNTSGDIFITGRTTSSSGIAASGAYQSSLSGTVDGFIAKYNNAGVLQWSTYYGNTGDDDLTAADIGPNGHLYAFGHTTSTLGMAATGAYQPAYGGGVGDDYMVEFTNTGTRAYATYLGGIDVESGYCSIACANAAVYAGGSTTSYGFATAGSYQSSPPIGFEVFVAKFITDTVAFINQPFTDTALCIGDTIQLHYTTSYKFASANIFTVQLSDAIGSFSSPVAIGTLAGDTSGTITCIIPPGTVLGTGYKLRIVASSPARTSIDNGKPISIGTGIAKPVSGSNTPVCTGAALHLSATVSTSNPAIKWNWAGPAGFTSNLQNPSLSNISSVNAGSYIVTASLYGCKAKDTNTVVVLPLPAAGITATTNGPTCTNDTLKLFSTNTLPGSSYSWTGPNSFSAATQNTSIVFPSATAAGDYIVTATLNGCSVKDTVTAQIKPVPDNVNATSNSPVCDHGNFTMNVSSGTTGVSYSWTGPGSFNAAVANPTLSNVSFVNGGDYIATVTLNGCTIKDTVTLIVNPLPAKPVATSNTALCTTDTLRLNATTTTAGAGYSWTGPNSFTSSLQNPSVNNPPVAAAGDYIVTATITATGCIARDTETVAITQSPSVNATNSSPVCEGSTVSLSSLASPVTAVYSWTGPGSFSSSAQNPVITTAATTASGDYIVSATLNGCTGKDTTTVLVKPNPIIPVTNSNTPVCIGGNIQLTASSNAGTTYSWTGPNTFSSGVQNPVRNNIVAADAGIYSVIATLNGCTSAAGTTTVVINPQPFVTIYATPADSACQGASVSFVALPANTSAAPQYKWTKNSSPAILATTSTYITNTLNNNDIVRCEITELQKCGVPFLDTSNEIKMTVLPNLTPSVTVTANPAGPLAPFQLVTFTAIPVNGGSNPQYQWTRNGTNVTGATAAGWSTQQLSNNDVICVKLTSSDKCAQPKTIQSNCITVTVLTGVNDIDNNTNIQLYPNPNDGAFTIKAGNISSRQVQLEIVNALGQLVYHAQVPVANKELSTTVKPGNIANGIYLLRLHDGPQLSTLKFMVNR